MIDLDKARAERGTKTGPKFKLDGVEYQLAGEMPANVLEAFKGMASDDNAAQAGAMSDVARALLGQHYDTVAASLSVEDLNVLVSGIMDEYGVSDPLPVASGS